MRGMMTLEILKTMPMSTDRSSRKFQYYLMLGIGIGIGIGIGLLKIHIAASKAELHEITV